MKWLLRELFAEKRLRTSALLGVGGLVLVLLGLVLPFPWLTKVGLFVGAPLMALGLVGTFAFTALFLVKDYKRHHA
jgi:hypothetical protein